MKYDELSISLMTVCQYVGQVMAALEVGVGAVTINAH